MTTQAIPDWKIKLMDIWDRRNTTAGFYELEELISSLIEKRGAKKRVITRQEEDRIIRMYRDKHFSIAAVQTAMGIDAKKIRLVLDKYHIPRRKSGACNFSKSVEREK